MAKEIEHGADGTELELEEGYNESRTYELGFHIDPELPETEVRKTYQSIIEAAGNVVAQGEPVSVQLAYTISRQENTGRRDFDSAYFCWVAYEADAEAHDRVLTAAKEEKRIIRFIDLKTTKEGAEHSAEMRELYMRTNAPEGEESEDEGSVSEGELDAALKDAGVS